MNKKVKILIVEDEVLIADYIHEMLNNEGYNYVKVAYDCYTALNLFKEFKPEIILLDINIDHKDSGIELAKKRNSLAQIIYLTAQYDELTIQKALETLPVSYLTKPLRKIEIIAAIKLAVIKMNKNFIIKRDGHKEIKILFSDILFVKSDGNYLDIYTTDKKYVIRQSLDTLYLELDSSIFSKTHRSYIVNTTKITAKTSAAVFINSIEIPLSRNFSTHF